MRLVVFNRTRRRVPRKQLQRLSTLIAAEERRTQGRGAVNVIFTTDAHLRRLNKRYRHRDQTTDVLSFNLEGFATERDVFGEVYISVAAATRNASACGVSRQQELLRLTAHGLLHLLGYDHGDQRSSGRMLARQERYLERLGGGGHD